jgi:hypothetical protein
MGRTRSTHAEKRNAYRVMLGTTKRKRLPRKPSFTLVDNIKMNLVVDRDR